MLLSVFVNNLALQCGSGPLVSEVCGAKVLEFSCGPYRGLTNRRTSHAAAERAHCLVLGFLFLPCSPNWVGGTKIFGGGSL